MKSFLVYTITFILTICSAFSQSVLTGKITDSTSGEPIVGASVSLLNTKKGSYTNKFGTYTIKNIQPQIYSIRVSSVGYEPKVIDGMDLTDNDTLNIKLSFSNQLSKEIVIQAERSKDNAASLLVDRKNSDQISDRIGKEEISKLPDSDAGQALKRVSGITLVDGKFVYVRGLSDRYSNTTLNGSTISSTEQDKKSFAFDMFPSDLLENANVIKSFTPDLPGNFSGGLVQLNTINFPTTTGFKITSGTGWNSNITFIPNGFLHTNGGPYDWLGMGDGSRKLPQSFPQNRREMNDLLMGIRAHDPQSISRMDEIGRQFNNNNWKTNNSTALPNGNLSLTYKEVIDVGDEDKLGIVGSISWGSSIGQNLLVRNAVLSTPTDFLFQSSGISSSQSFGWGGLINTSYRFGETSTLSFKNTYNRSGESENVYLRGENFAQSTIGKSFSFQWVEKTLYSGTISGDHSLSDGMKLNWKGGYSTSTRNEPDYRRLQFLRQSSDVGSPLFAAIEITPQGAGSRAGRFYSNLTDDVFNASIDFTLPIGNVKLKTGGLSDYRERKFSARSITIVQSSHNDLYELYQIPDDDDIPDLSPLFVDSAYDAQRGRLWYSEDSRLSDAYDANELLVSGYLMADIPFGICKFVGGIRVENNRQILNSFSVNDQPVRVDQQFLDFLPALNFIIKPTDNFNIRISGSQTLTRPTFRELAPFQFYDFQIQSSIVGNPNLKRSLIQNGDIRFDYFLGVGEVASISCFYKRFQNAIEETIVPQSSEIARSFANANGDAQNYGVEFELRKSLGFIGDGLSNFLISFNGALIQSNISVSQGGTIDRRTMWGQSPYTINLSLFYTNQKWNTSITAGYNRCGERIIQVNQVGVFQGNPHIYEMPRDVIDFSVIQGIGEKLELKFSVKDLLNQPLIWQQGGTIIQSNIRGTSVSFSFSYRM